jgi:hypothetical protein
MFDSEQFDAWYARTISEGTTFPPGTWVAIDPNQNVIDQDENSNELLGRLENKRIDPAVTRIIYCFPRDFV